MRTKKRQSIAMLGRTLLAVMLICVLAGTVYAAEDCGPVPCPGTLPAIWPHPSATEGGAVRILGWNLAPAAVYEVVVVRPDGVAASNGYVTTDVEGGILGRFDGPYGQPYVCAVQDLGVVGIHQVRIYPSPWSGSLDEVPVAVTSFYHN